MSAGFQEEMAQNRGMTEKKAAHVMAARTESEMKWGGDAPY